MGRRKRRKAEEFEVMVPLYIDMAGETARQAEQEARSLWRLIWFLVGWNMGK